jgi:hypothetical protein
MDLVREMEEQDGFPMHEMPTLKEHGGQAHPRRSYHHHDHGNRKNPAPPAIQRGVVILLFPRNRYH